MFGAQISCPVRLACLVNPIQKMISDENASLPRKLNFAGQLRNTWAEPGEGSPLNGMAVKHSGKQELANIERMAILENELKESGEREHCLRLRVQECEFQALLGAKHRDVKQEFDAARSQHASDVVDALCVPGDDL